MPSQLGSQKDMQALCQEFSVCLFFNCQTTRSGVGYSGNRERN